MRNFKRGRNTNNLQDPQLIVRRGQYPFQMEYLRIACRDLGMQRRQVFLMCSLTVVAETSFYNNRSNKYGVMTNIDVYPTVHKKTDMYDERNAETSPLYKLAGRNFSVLLARVAPSQPIKYDAKVLHQNQNV